VMGEMAESEVDRIMSLADTDGSGFVDFSEWLVVSINLANVLTDEKFKIVFDIFDVEKKGKIRPEEL
jgi:Ca2+-binding EF-hand superfamily protein